jgi:hypothetical protein
VGVVEFESSLSWIAGREGGEGAGWRIGRRGKRREDAAVQSRRTIAAVAVGEVVTVMVMIPRGGVEGRVKRW